jgi:hypothetical protein
MRRRSRRSLLNPLTPYGSKVFVVSVDGLLDEYRRWPVSSAPQPLTPGQVIGPLHRFQWDGLPLERALPIAVADDLADIWLTWPGVAWPFEIWRVDGEESAIGRAQTITIRRRVSTRQAFGPNGQQLVRLLDRASRLSEVEAKTLLDRAEALGLLAPSWRGGWLFGPAQWGRPLSQRWPAAHRHRQAVADARRARQAIITEAASACPPGQYLWLQYTLRELAYFCPAARQVERAGWLPELWLSAAVSLIADQDTAIVAVMRDVGLVS